MRASHHVRLPPLLPPLLPTPEGTFQVVAPGSTLPSGLPDRARFPIIWCLGGSMERMKKHMWHVLSCVFLDERVSRG